MDTTHEWKPSIDLGSLPAIELKHLFLLTDDTGIVQHASFSVPNYQHGYCVDDNARALLAGLIYGRLSGEKTPHIPVERYLAFVHYAFNPDTQRFRNFMSHDRRWLEDTGSEDSQGRAVWALGFCYRFAPNDSIKGLAQQLLERSLPAISQLVYVRPRAFALLGLDHYRQAGGTSSEIDSLQRRLTEFLYDSWRANFSSDWPWWETQLTWGNAKLPHALLMSGQGLGRDDMVQAALEVLTWLLKIQTSDGPCLSPVGNDGWFVRHGVRSRFDQQPIEAQGLVQACLAAAEVTGKQCWLENAMFCFEWFLGRNDLGLPLYNQETGGCHDGLNYDGLNPNQGTESTLAYLISLFELHWHRRRHHLATKLSHST